MSKRPLKSKRLYWHCELESGYRVVDITKSVLYQYKQYFAIIRSEKKGSTTTTMWWKQRNGITLIIPCSINNNKTHKNTKISSIILIFHVQFRTCRFDSMRCEYDSRKCENDIFNPNSLDEWTFCLFSLRMSFITHWNMFEINGTTV